MGRAALLAIAVVLGLASHAFAEPVQCSWFSPERDDADSRGQRGGVDVGFESSGTTRGDLASEVGLIGSIPPTIASVRLTIRDLREIERPLTAVLHPSDGYCNLGVAYKGEVLVAVELGDAGGHYRDPFFVMREGHGYDEVVGFDPKLMHWFAIGFGFMIVSLIAVLRRIHRGTNGEPPLVISPVLAEVLARRARNRDGRVAVLVILVGLAAMTIVGNWVLAGSVWILMCLGDYWVASRTVELLERPRAIAELYGTNLVVRADDHTSSVLLSRQEIKRARRHAIPRAAVQ